MYSTESMKMVVIGPSGVGKTSLLLRLFQDRFDPNSESTIGMAFFQHHFSYQGKNYSLDCWDTAGQERFRSIVPLYFKDVDGILIVFDATSLESFQQVRRYWIPLMKDHFRDRLPALMLLANKIDRIEFSLPSYQQVEEQLELLQSMFVEDVPIFKTSALTGHHVSEMFQALIPRMIQFHLLRKDTMRSSEIFSLGTFSEEEDSEEEEKPLQLSEGTYFWWRPCC